MREVYFNFIISFFQLFVPFVMHNSGAKSFKAIKRFFDYYVSEVYY